MLTKNEKQNETRRLRNQAVKSKLKTLIRKAAEAPAEIRDLRVADACRELDVAASKGVIHKNQAARRKSRLTQKTAP